MGLGSLGKSTEFDVTVMYLPMLRLANENLGCALWMCMMRIALSPRELAFGIVVCIGCA
jgi:hypothetical protein